MTVCLAKISKRLLWARKMFIKKNKEFNVGFAAENKFKALQRRDLVEKEAVTNVLNNVRSCVVAILKKMFDKSPIGSVVVHKVSVLNPDSIFVAKKGGSS